MSDDKENIEYREPEPETIRTAKNSLNNIYLSKSYLLEKRIKSLLMAQEKKTPLLVRFFKKENNLTNSAIICLLIIILPALYLFLKYFSGGMANKGLIKITISIFIPLVLIFAGECFKKRINRSIYVAFSSAGIVALYLSIYMAYFYYHLLSQVAAFIIMLVITIYSVAISVRFNSIQPIIISIATGFATPLLLNIHFAGYEMAILLYALLFNIIILLVAYAINWNYLNIYCFVFTHLLFWILYIQKSLPQNIFATEIFYSLYFILFFTFLFVFEIVMAGREMKDYDLIIILANPIFYFLGNIIMFLYKYPVFIGISSSLITLVYLLGGFILIKREIENKTLSRYIWGTGISFLIITILFVLKGLFDSIVHFGPSS